MNKISELNKTIINSYNEINQSLDIFISEYADQKKKEYFTDLVPMFYKEFTETSNKILFVGINPSFNQRIYSGINLGIFKYSIFREKNIKNKIKIINELIHIQEGLIYGNYSYLKQIQYFKNLESFSYKVGFENSWVHFDLFPNRCTDQFIFTKAISRNEFINYKKLCLNRFDKIIKENTFKAILILNKASSIFIQKNLLNLELSKRFEEFKHPIYGLYFLNKTPVILFKQLSQGATSNIELKKFSTRIKNILK